MMSGSFISITGEPVRVPNQGEIYEPSTCFLIIGSMICLGVLGFMAGKNDSSK